MKSAKTTNFFHDKPLFGLDVGHGSIKVMQTTERHEKSGKKPSKAKLIGYGATTFDSSAQADGIIVKPEVIAKAAYELFSNGLLGDITTRRAAMAIPAYRTFTRSLQLPHLNPDELKEAVQLEAEQYISVPLEELYLDYEVVKQTADNTELLLVAVPRTIVDSYCELGQLLGLEAILIEPTLSSSSRLFATDTQSDVAACIIDFGSVSADISIFDKHTLVTGTAAGGGEDFTEAIKKALGVTQAEASLIKTRYGLGVSKKQAEIRRSLDPVLSQIVKEIRRMMRYYEERYGTDRPISQVITLGGGANLPGLSEYFTETLRIAVRHSDPWEYLDSKHLAAPSTADKAMYATVAGLSLANPKQVFEL